MNRRTIPQDRRELYACRPRRTADGIAIITGWQDQDGWSLFEGTKYYLVETQAPQGYLKRSDKIYFTVKDNPTAADEYPDPYTIPWSNTPEKSDTAFTIHKIDANTAASLQGAQFTLSDRRSTGEDITQNLHNHNPKPARTHSKKAKRPTAMRLRQQGTPSWSVRICPSPMTGNPILLIGGGALMLRRNR